MEGAWGIGRGSSPLRAGSLVHAHCLTAVHSQGLRMKKSALAQEPGDLGLWPGSAPQCVT